MDILEAIKNTLLFPKLSYYIILIQIPIALCLSIQCYQVYKLNFKGFKFITLAWAANLIYLVFIILLKKIQVQGYWQSVPRTCLDAICIFFFFRGSLYNIEQQSSKFFNRKTIRALYHNPEPYFGVLLLFALFVKNIPGVLIIIPYIRLRFVPIAFLNFMALYLLARYFKTQAKKFHRSNSIFSATIVYAFLQFISILQPNSNEPPPNFLNIIDNIGFSIGLIAKIIILISLLLFLIKVSIEEKNKLLNKLKFATKILNIEDQFLENNQTKKLSDYENAILKPVLEECLNMLNEQLGFYGSYNDKTKEITISFSSEKYAGQIGYTYPIEMGISGKAIKLHDTQGPRNVSETPEHFKFSDLPDENYRSGIDKKVKSAIAIPVILNKNEVIGVYLFESEFENYITQTDADILKAIVAQAVAAIKNIRLILEIELERTVLKSLKLIDKNLVDKSLALEHILELILGQTLTLSKATLANISLVTSKKELVIKASTNRENINETIPINDSITGSVAITGKKIYIADINTAEQEHVRLFKRYLHPKVVCELAVPLMGIKDEVLGVLNIESRTSNRFTENDIAIIEGFAGQAAVAVYISKLFEDIKRHKNSLQELANIELSILKFAQTLPEILETILKTGLSLIKKKHGEILLLNPAEENSRYLVVKKSSYPGAEEGRKISLNSISGLAINREKSVYLPYVDIDGVKPADLNEQLVYLPDTKERLLYRTPPWGQMKSELVMLITLNNKVIGVLNIESEEYDDFRENEVALLDNLAHAAAMAIHSSRQFEEINLKNRALENSIDKSKVEISTIIGRAINHNIVNSAGAIKAIVKFKLLGGLYGDFDAAVLKDFNTILLCAEQALDSNSEVKEKVMESLYTQPTVVNFQEIENEITKRIYLQPNDNVEIETVGFDKLKPMVISRSLLMDVIFYELIANAIKAMSKGGKITITGDSEKGFNIFTFEDEGCGIDPKEIKKIFNENYTKWADNEGKGIGLYMLKKILTFLEGSVNVESEFGKGTTFIIKLPIHNSKKL